MQANYSAHCNHAELRPWSVKILRHSSHLMITLIMGSHFLRFYHPSTSKLLGRGGSKENGREKSISGSSGGSIWSNLFDHNKSLPTTFWRPFRDLELRLDEDIIKVWSANCKAVFSQSTQLWWGLVRKLDIKMIYGLNLVNPSHLIQNRAQLNHSM